MSIEFWIGAGLGLFGNLIASFIFDRSKSPNLKISVGNKTEPNPVPNRPTTRYSFLHFNVQNINKHGITNAAFGAKAKIIFKSLSKNNDLFSIDGRWSGNPEPLIPMDAYGRIARVNPTTYPLLRKIDILAGTTEELDVAIKYDDEDSIYAFSNESYEPPDGKMWRKAAWELKETKILVEVTVYSGDVKKTGLFILHNPNNKITDVHIEPYAKEA